MRVAIGSMIIIAIIVVVVAIASYRLFYQYKINKQLQDESTKYRTSLSPLTFSIIFGFAVLIVFAGMLTIMALTDFGAVKVSAVYRNAIYDYQDYNPDQMTGYRSTYSIEENLGYIKNVEQKGDIRFTYFIREDNFDIFHPTFIIYVEYTGDKEILYRGVQGDFTVENDMPISNRGSAGGEFKNYLCVFGNATIQSTFDLTVYLYDSNLKSENFREYAAVVETLTILIHDP